MNVVRTLCEFGWLGERLLATLVFCLAVGGQSAPASVPGEVRVGETLREARLQGLNGPPRSLSSFRGRPLVINVWASWCGPCRQEMASLERLAWRDQGRYFAIIGISTDDDAERANMLLKNSNATISHFIDQHLQMERMLGATHLPLTVLVDSNGRVIRKVYGAREWDDDAALRLVAESFHERIPNTRGTDRAVGNSK